MSNYINKYVNSAAFDADNTKQFPNTSLVGNNVVYNPTDPDDSNVTIDMTLPSTMEVTLFDINDNQGTLIDPATYLDYIKVDGTSVNLATLYANDNALQMTSGNHIVKYKVKNPATTDINLFAIVNYDNSYNNSMVFGEGFTTFSQGSGYILTATNIVLPSTFQYIGYAVGSGEYDCTETPFNCTNLTLKYNGVVSLPYCEVACSGYDVGGACYEDCIEWTCEGETDPETGDCLDEEVCTAGGTEQSLITYLIINASNLYVPSAQVSAYNASGWSDSVEASAIQA